MQGCLVITAEILVGLFEGELMNSVIKFAGSQTSFGLSVLPQGVPYRA